MFGKIYQQQANAQGAQGADPGAQAGGAGGAQNEQKVYDADYEVVDDEKDKDNK